MTTFPASIISFPLRVNGQVIDAGDINSPDNEITAVEVKVGVDNSTDPTSLDYLIKSPLSNGGGHIQTAPLGGTGQTTFMKGDILVASNSSTLTRLGVGADGLAIVADSTQTGGIVYRGVATAGQIQNQTYTYARASVISASVYGINLSQAVSILSDGQAFAIKWPTTNTTSILALSVNATGPSSVVARIKNPDGTNIAVGAIVASSIGIVEFDSVSSIFQLATTPDAGTLVGTLPVLNGGNLTNLPAPTVFNTTTSIVGTASSSSVILAHGLNRVPKMVEVVAMQGHDNGGTAHTLNQSNGMYNGSISSNVRYTITTAASGGGLTGMDNTYIVYIADSASNPTAYQRATCLVDSTNITLAFFYQPTLNGDPINMLIKSF